MMEVLRCLDVRNAVKNSAASKPWPVTQVMLTVRSNLQKEVPRYPLMCQKQSQGNRCFLLLEKR
jgi:hypothetical protein